jgi:hypothetical protein
MLRGGVCGVKLSVRDEFSDRYPGWEFDILVRP